MTNRPYPKNNTNTAIQSASQKWIEEADIRYPENFSELTSSPLVDCESKSFRLQTILLATAFLLVIGGGVGLIIYRIRVTNSQDRKGFKKDIGSSEIAEPSMQKLIEDGLQRGEESESSSSDSTQLLGRYQREDLTFGDHSDLQELHCAIKKSSLKSDGAEFIESLLKGFRDETCKISLIKAYMQRLPIRELPKPCVEEFNNHLIKCSVESPSRLGPLVFALSLVFLKKLPPNIVLALPENLFLDNEKVFDLSDLQHPAQIFNQVDSLSKFSNHPLVVKCRQLYHHPLTG